MAIASGVEEFIRTIPGQRTTIKDVDSIIDFSGDFRKLYDIDVIIKSITNLFLISKETYFMDPNVGTNLYRYIFEPADIATKSQLEQEISVALSAYMYNDVDIEYDIVFFNNKKGFKINFEISYKGKKKTRSVTINEQLLTTIQ